MPTIRVSDVELFYQESGHGPETIVFSHGLGRLGGSDDSRTRAKSGAFERLVGHAPGQPLGGNVLSKRDGDGKDSYTSVMPTTLALIDDHGLLEYPAPG